MSRCLHNRELEDFLRGEGLPDAGEHLASCAACRQSLLETARRQGAVNALLLTLARSRDCLEYEELSDCLEGRITSQQSLTAWLHLSGCEYCQGDLTALAAGRVASRSLPEVVLAPAVLSSPSWQTCLAAWKERVSRHRPLRLAGAMAVIVVGFMLGYGFLSEHFGYEKMAFRPDPPAPFPIKAATPSVWPLKGVSKGGDLPGQSASSSKAMEKHRENNLLRKAAPSFTLGKGGLGPKPPLSIPHNKKPAQKRTLPSPSPRKPAEPVLTVLLYDEAGKVAMGKEGKLKWPDRLPDTPPSLAEMVEEKVRSGSLSADLPILMVLAAPSGDTVRDREAAITLKEPVGTSVLSATPRLHWVPLMKKAAYRVRLFDSEGQPAWEAGTPESLIQISTPLEGGAIYYWEVTGDDGEKVYFSRPARFRVVEESVRERIESLVRHYRGWHLVLGTLYESEGLYQEARREFLILQQLNPASSLARSLLEGIEEKQRLLQPE